MTPASVPGPAAGRFESGRLHGGLRGLARVRFDRPERGDQHSGPGLFAHHASPNLPHTHPLGVLRGAESRYATDCEYAARSSLNTKKTLLQASPLSLQGSVGNWSWGLGLAANGA